MSLRHCLPVLALALVATAASPVFAIKLLQPGAQSLQGVVLRSDVGGLSLAIDCGSRSEQRLRLDPATADLRAELERVAVPAKPGADPYEGAQRVLLAGELRVIASGPSGCLSQVFRVDSIALARGSETVTKDLGALKDELRQMAQDSEDAKNVQALTILERSGLLDKMVQKLATPSVQ